MIPSATSLHLAVWLTGGGLLFLGMDWRRPVIPLDAASALAAAGYLTAFFQPVSRRWSSLGSLFLLCAMFQFGFGAALACIFAMSVVDLASAARKTLSASEVAYLLAARIIAASSAWPFAQAWRGDGGGFAPAAIASAAFVFFSCSALLGSLHGACTGAARLPVLLSRWFEAPWPYFTVGTVLAGLLPLSQWAPRPEGWLVLAPAVYFAHFLDGLWLRPERMGVESAATASRLPALAKTFLTVVVAGGLGLVAAGLVRWPIRFGSAIWFYTAAAALCSTCKVRFPRMEGSVSLGLLPVLISTIERGITESLIIAAISVVVQSYWKPVSRPAPVQVLFNSCCLVLSVGFTIVMARVLEAATPEPSLALRLAWSTTVLYLTNTFIVAVMMAAAEGRADLLKVWRGCYFWAFPYYLVGAAGAGLIIHAGRQLGWQAAMFLAPSVLALGLSYRFRMRESQMLELGKAS